MLHGAKPDNLTGFQHGMYVAHSCSPGRYSTLQSFHVPTWAFSKSETSLIGSVMAPSCR